MRHALAMPMLLVLSGAASATPAQRDARMDGYLAIWSRDAAITPANVARLYARRVNYYGHAMSAEAVYRDKLAFAKAWPVRRYAAEPGTVTNDCGAAADTCRVAAVMRWSRSGAAGHREAGTNSVRLDLAREDGALKIVRESGEPVTGSHRHPGLQ